MTIRKKILTQPPEFPRFYYEDEVKMTTKLTRKEQKELAQEAPKPGSEDETPKSLFTYAKGYEHWGPERLEDALYEAVHAPSSRSMWRYGQGATMDVRTMIWDMLDVLVAWKRPGCAVCN